MTIALVTAVPQGIILASESRTINGSPEWYANFEKGIYSDDFKVLGDNHPKVHKVGRYGLIYSGVSSLTLSGFGLTSDWTSDQEIANLQCVAANGASFRVLAETFYKRLSTVLNGRGFSFVLCGYDVGGNQVWAEGGSDVPFSINGGPGVRPYYCFQALGAVDVIRKLISDELIRFERMSLQEALTFTLFTISVGCKYLKWFDRLPEVSGGPIYVAVIMPGGGIRGFKFPEYDPAVPGGAIPWQIPDITLQNGSASAGGTCGREIGGNIYASKIRSGEEGATTYTELGAGGSDPLTVVENGKTALNVWASGGGLVQWYDTVLNNMVGQILPTEAYFGSGGLKIHARNNTGTTKNIAIVGDTIYLDSDTEVNVQGNLFVSGRLDVIGRPKNAVEETSQGLVALAAVESPEVLYMDRAPKGVAELVNGECRVDLDPLFLECIIPNSEETPWNIICTPKGPFTLYETEIGDTYFIIKSHEPEINGKFSWVLLAVRKNMAGIRLQKRPELEAKIQEMKLRKAGLVSPAPVAEESQSSPA
ncbi:MAG: hypothetical protein A4E53_00744 [Pelotomaculum sp. PtaB.Bin104]|nr:MAG: hypothetical protein A4E53_00744 [Pelotomaculum sp. PtaB.Bin104]